MAAQAALFAEVFRVAGTDIAALLAIVTHPSQAGTIWDAWQEDLKGIDDQTRQFINDLDKQATAQENVNKQTTDAVMTAKQLADVQKELEQALHDFDAEAKAALEDWLKMEAAIRKINEDVVASLEDQKQAQLAADTVRAMGYQELTAAEKNAADIRSKAIDQYVQMTAAIGDTATQTQTYRELLDGLDGKFDETSNAQRAWLQQMLNGPSALAKLSDEAKALSAGFDRFVDSVSQGSVTVAQAFKGMVESIIADLLKIWAKKYILDFFFPNGPAGVASGTGGEFALGAAFDAGRVVPFARGGVVSSSVKLPMALLGEAGPEAVMPLSRGADGRLGVAGGASQVNVTVNNNAPGVDVSTRQTGPSDLEIIVQRTREAIAADVRAGGTPVARAFEQAYALGRGAAAPF